MRIFGWLNRGSVSRKRNSRARANIFSLFLPFLSFSLFFLPLFLPFLSFFHSFFLSFLSFTFSQVGRSNQVCVPNLKHVWILI